jgi:3-hydroxyacyl-CoA dehydrogenase
VTATVPCAFYNVCKQAALWREAVHLVDEGVASVHDVDLAVSAGRGLRRALVKVIAATTGCL